jgi:CspA family cold shock protein
MQEGILEFFNTEKGFGFITPSNGGTQIFVHVSGLSVDVLSLEPGQQLRFDVEEGRKGPNAVNVVIQ